MLKYKKQNSVDFKVLIQCYFSVNRINAQSIDLHEALYNVDLKL
jgi:hypothetical protein